MNDGVAICIDVDPSRIARRIEHRYLDVEADSLDARAASWPSRPATRGGRCRSALLGNAAELVPQLLASDAPIDIVTDQTSAHDPLSYLPIGVDVRGLARRTPRPSPRSSPAGRGRRWPRTSRRWSASWTRAPRSSTTATRSAARRSSAGYDAGLRLPRLRARPTSGRCSARARARSAGRRCPATRADIAAHRPGRCSSCSPRTSRWPAGSRMAGERVHFQGLPARICWLGYGERDQAGLRFNELVASRRAPGADRDRPRPPRLRLGRLALPRDRGDGSTARTRSPTGRCSTRWSTSPPGRPGCRSTTAAASASAARSTPARCPSPTAPSWPPQKLERVLTNDPGMGVIRHVDAGYDRAVEVADERGVRVPMRD